MRLVRNTTEDGTCKYALIRLDKLQASEGPLTKEKILAVAGDLAPYIEFGLPNTEDEFFTIKLKDINAKAALDAYAVSASQNADDELSNDVLQLSFRAGTDNPWCKKPD